MSFFNTLSFSFISELKQIFHSPYKIALISWLPLLTFMLIMYIFSSDVVRRLPIAVVDHDHSRLSRSIKSDIDASATFSIAQTPLSMLEAKKALSKGDIYAIVYIKEDFQKDVFLYKQPSITAMVNAQYILIGKNVTSSLFEIIAQSSAKLDTLKILKSTQHISFAIEESSPINISINGYFNEKKNYFYFLISALIPAIWQIFIVVASVTSIGSLFKEEDIQAYFSKGTVLPLLMGKMLPYTLSYLAWGITFLFYLYGVDAWPFQGSCAITILAMLLTVMAYQSISLFLFSLSFDYARSLSLGAVYTAPAFAFIGITFPTFSMPFFATCWHNALPISHYMKLQIAQANYGADVLTMLPLLATISLFMLLWPFILWRFKNYLKDIS